MINNIQLSNFQPYGDHIHRTIGEGLVLVNGILDDNAINSNGAGKSSLFEAISWCLFGYAADTHKWPSGDHLIRHTPELAQDMTVTVIIGNYSITRSRSRGKHTELYLYKDNENISAKKIDDTQILINTVLRMDLDMYLSTIYFRQKEAVSVCDMSPKDSKALVLKILNSYMWDEYKAKISELKAINWDRLTEQMSARQAMISMVDKAKELLSSNDDNISEKISYCENEIESFNRDKQAKLLVKNNYQNDLNKINDLRKQISDLTIKITMIESDIRTKSTEISRLLDAKVKLHDLISAREASIAEISASIMVSKLQLLPISKREQLQVSIDELQTNYNKLLSSLENSKAQSLLVQREIDTLNKKVIKIKELGDVCIECLNPITQEYKMVTLTELNDNIINLKDNQQSLDVSIKAIISEIEVCLTSRKQLLAELSADDATIGKVTLLNSTLKSEQALLASDNIRLTELDNNSKFISTDIEKLNIELVASKTSILLIDKQISVENVVFVENEITKINTALEIIDSTINSNNLLYQDLLKKLGNIESVKNTINSYVNDIAEMNKSINVYEYENDVFSILFDAFSSNGIPSYIIGGLSHSICDIANDILMYIGLPYTINIVVYRDSKTESGKAIPTFTIEVLHKDTGIIQNYSQFSGGESYWIDLSLRLAYMMISMYKRESPVSFMIFDEGVGKLDPYFRDKFLDLMRYIINTHGIKQIFLVSHTDLASRVNQFDDVITVVKDNGVATLR